MLPKKFIDKLRELAFTIAPELQAFPFYVVESPDSFPQGGCLGLTLRSANCVLREMLVESGEWTGPGNTIVLFPNVVKNYSDMFGLYRTLTGIFLHELAHVVPVEPPCADIEEPTAELAEFQSAVLRELAAAPSIGPRWEPDHGLKFIRRFLHLHHRASYNEYLIPFSDACGGEAYGLSPLRDYRQALGDEPKRMLDASFAGIEATSAPLTFTNLFDRDVATWAASQAVA